MSELQSAAFSPRPPMTASLSPRQRVAADKMAHVIEELNVVVAQAVETGLTVELVRTHRSHGAGAFGDQIKAAVKQVGQ
jgi:hypothetical protein